MNLCAFPVNQIRNLRGICTPEEKFQRLFRITFYNIVDKATFLKKVFPKIPGSKAATDNFQMIVMGLYVFTNPESPFCCFLPVENKADMGRLKLVQVFFKDRFCICIIVEGSVYDFCR